MVDQLMCGRIKVNQSRASWIRNIRTRREKRFYRRTGNICKVDRVSASPGKLSGKKCKKNFERCHERCQKFSRIVEERIFGAGDQNKSINVRKIGEFRGIELANDKSVASLG